MQGKKVLPREKFEEMGIDSLTDLELVSILVGSGVKGKNFSVLSKKILAKIRDIYEKGRGLELGDLASIGGVGKVTEMRILVGIEMGRRLYYPAKHSERVCNSVEAYKYFEYLEKKKKEYLVAIFLNSRFEILSKKIITIGSLNVNRVLPRDIIVPALEYNAASVVIAHNHPSGDCSVSDEDKIITKRIKDAMDIVGLSLLDHIVIGFSSWESVQI